MSVNLEKYIEQLEREISEELGEIEEEEVKPEKIVSSLSYVMKRCLSHLTDDVRVKVFKTYNELIKKGQVVEALELHTRFLNPFGRICFILSKPRQAIKNCLDALSKRYFNMPLSKLLPNLQTYDLLLQDLMSELEKVVEKIENSLVEAFKANCEAWITPTLHWQKWFSFIPGLTPLRVALIQTYAPPHRFDSFGRYRVYVGTAPKKYYEEKSKLLGRPKHWHPRAKMAIYQAVLLTLRRKNINAYYATVFDQRFSANVSKILNEVGYKSFNEIRDKEERDRLRAKAFFYAVKETCDIFAHHYWYFYRNAYGLPVHDPYVIEKLKHQPYYRPAVKINGKWMWVIDLPSGKLDRVPFLK